jgi:hypothetical protein
MQDVYHLAELLDTRKRKKFDEESTETGGA